MGSSTPSISSIKYRWYQTDNKVTVEIPIKNVVEDNIKISFTADTMSVFIKLPNDEEYKLNTNLQHSIIPEKCSFKARPTKVEIILVKEIQIRWDELEKVEKKPDTINNNKTKNWDKLVKENINEEEDDTVDKLFTKIYEGGTDEQKRAMLKSFTESGGTVLSTNWNEVSRKKVEMNLPEGVEFKRW